MNIPKITIVTHKRLADIFNEWNKRYSENPDDFKNNLNKDGKPLEDYGECCADYFEKLAKKFNES